MKLPIADCRLPITSSTARCGFARRGHNCCEVVGLLQKSSEFALGNGSRLNEQFEPQSRLIRFFFDGANLSIEFRLASSAAGRPIICGYRGATSNNLLRNNAPSVIALWNCPGQLDNAKGKSLGALFELDRIHAPNLQNQSPIANCQSPIPV